MNITISMPKQYVDKLKAEAQKTGLTYSELIRRALDVRWDNANNKN